MSAEGKSYAKSSHPYSRGQNAEMSNQGYAAHGKNTKIADKALYYSPAKPTAFATLNKLSA